MRQLVRVLIVLLALAEAIAWTLFTIQVWQWGKTGAGAGDGAGSGASTGAAVFGFLLIGAIWFFPVSPYICMACGALNIISGKSLRVAFAYSLVVLVLLTLTELVSFQPRLELMALGNIAASALWGFSLRGTGNAHNQAAQPQ